MSKPELVNYLPPQQVLLPIAYTRASKPLGRSLFPSVDQGQIRSSRFANLERVVQQATVGSYQILNEYLTASAWELKENHRAYDMCLNNREQCETELVQISMSPRLISIFHLPVGLAARADLLSPRQAGLEKACWKRNALEGLSWPKPNESAV